MAIKRVGVRQFANQSRTVIDSLVYGEELWCLTRANIPVGIIVPIEKYKKLLRAYRAQAAKKEEA